MGRVIESKDCKITITKQSLADGLLSGVNPGILIADVDDIKLSSDSTFIEVLLSPSTVSGKTTVRVFQFSKKDFVDDVLSVADPELNDPEMISNLELDSDPLKILVTLNRKQVAVY